MALAGQDRKRMKRRFLEILSIILLILPAGCGKPSSPSTNPKPTIDYKQISSGAVKSLTSLQTSFRVLRDAATDPIQKQKWANAYDAITRILNLAKPIDTAIQETTFPAKDTKALADQIANLATVASSVAGTVGLPDNLVIGINLAVGVFQSLEPLIFGTNGPPPGAAGDTAANADPRTRLGRLQGIDAQFKLLAGRKNE